MLWWSDELPSASPEANSPPLVADGRDNSIGWERLSVDRRFFLSPSFFCFLWRWWWCRASCPRMLVAISETNCDQCLSTVQCCFTSTETIRLIQTGSPGRPPRLSRSSWTLSFLCSLRYFMQATDDWCFIRFKVGLHVSYVTEKESGALSAKNDHSKSLFCDLKSEAGRSDSNSKPWHFRSKSFTSFGAARTLRVWHNCCSPAFVFYCSGSVGLTGVSF